MTLKTPLWMQKTGGDPDISYAAVDDRAMFPAMFHDEGVQDTVFGSLKVSQRGAGANFSVDVAAGRAWVFGDDVSNQGMYMVESTAVANLAIPSPPGSGTRIHRVVAQVKDKLHNGSYSTYEWTLDVLQDTGSGTPALPASAISLATVSVSAGQASVLNANITDLRTQACLITSKYPLVSSDSSRPPNGFDSELIYRTDKDCYEMADGGSWYEVPRRGGGGSAWTTYTPSLTAVTTNPTLGTGSSREGAYMQIGKQVTVRANFKFGTSGVNAGSGIYRISLPVTSKTLTTGRHVGSAYAFDDSANDVLDGVCYAEIGQWGVVNIVLGGSLATNNVPWTWAANDAFGLTITYEAA